MRYRFRSVAATAVAAASLCVYPALAEAPCTGDLDDNGEVEFGDLLGIITAWGPCGVSCSEDLDGDDIVGFSDLLEVLTAWGPC